MLLDRLLHRVAGRSTSCTVVYASINATQSPNGGCFRGDVHRPAESTTLSVLAEEELG